MRRRQTIDQMTLRATLVSAGLAVCLQSCGNGRSLIGPSDTAVTFSGRVLDYLADAPIPHSLVTFALDPADPAVSPSETTTNADGSYALTVPRTGMFVVSVDGVTVGTARVTGKAYRGDLFVDRGTCIARYGIVIDRRTLRPIGRARLSFDGGIVTTSDGWYRADLGCPAVVFPGGTSILYVTHPDYKNRQLPLGRGINDVRRLDLDMERR